MKTVYLVLATGKHYKEQPIYAFGTKQKAQDWINWKLRQNSPLDRTMSFSIAAMAVL